MNASDIQTIFLLERYTSCAYFFDLLETWRTFVAHNEQCLNRYMGNLPNDARTRPLPNQADVTWGNTVLPNFRNTLQDLEDGYRRLLSGDLGGLTSASGPVNDHRGVVEFATDWMTDDELKRFVELLERAYTPAYNIHLTEGAYWGPGALSYRYNAAQRGLLSLPNALPRYVTTNDAGVRTGEPIHVPGIYIPDVAHSSPQFLNDFFEAPEATILVSTPSDSKNPITDKTPCTWRRIQRISDSVETVQPMGDQSWQRLLAGERCRVSGFYFSPARKESRQRFEAGELTPDLGSNFGATIWQWDEKQ